MPITSPVARISGPSTVSTSGKRLNGSTASFTDTCSRLWQRVGSSSWSRSASRSPSSSRQAIFASGTPTAFDTNGTVREARGLASITYSSSSPYTANWMLISPTTPSRSASRRVASSTRASISVPSDIVGMTQAESPECTPASSTCCMIPPIATSSPSQSASTSISIASSRKRSR